MAFTLKLKSSVVKDKVPLPSDIEIGEVCVGAHSQSPMLLFKDNADNIIQIKPGSGVTPGPNPPDDKQPGDIWYDENTNSLKYWNGTTWVELEASTGSSVDSVNGKSGVVILKTSDLENDSGYITIDDVPDVPDAPVASVNGKEGVVILTYTDVGAASAEQGGKADSALQPGADISKLNNDVGYITSSEVPDTGVTSVNGDVGPAVTLDAADVGALASGDDISELTNDSGYITAADVPEAPVASVTAPRR